MDHRPTFTDFALLLFISFIWGSSFMAIKIGLTAFDPFSLAALRVLAAGIFMYTVAKFKGEVFPTDRPTLKNLAIMGLFGSSAFILISWGQQYIDSSLAGIILGFGPLNVLLLAHFMTEDEKLTREKVFGFLAGFAGIMVLFGGAGFDGIEGNTQGMLALFVATFCYAFSMMFVKRMQGVSSINVATGFLVMAAFVAVPLSLVFDPPWTHEFTTEATLAVLFLGIMSTGLSSILLIYLVKRAGATFSSYSNYITPLVAVLWGVTLLDEKMMETTWIALALILSGMAISHIKTPKKPLP